MRDIRIILLEHVRLPTLSSLNPKMYTPEQHLDLFAKVMEDRAIMDFQGVLTDSYSWMQNTFVSTPDISSPDFHLVYFDFAHADTGEMESSVTLPYSPLGYLPDEWDDWLKFPDRPFMGSESLRRLLYQSRWNDSPRFQPPTDYCLQEMRREEEAEQVELARMKKAGPAAVETTPETGG